MATQPFRKFMTYQEFEDLPRLHEITELLDGEYFVVSPLFRHQRLVTRILLELGVFLKANPALGEVLTAPFDTVLSKPLHRVIQPDVFVLTTPTLARIEAGARLLGMPDLAVEVLSRDGKYDRGKKLQFYGEYRIPELWHVSQNRARIEVYRTADTFEKVADLGPGDTLTSPLLPGFELAIDALYAGLLQ